MTATIPMHSNMMTALWDCILTGPTGATTLYSQQRKKNVIYMTSPLEWNTREFVYTVDWPSIIIL